MGRLFVFLLALCLFLPASAVAQGPVEFDVPAYHRVTLATGLQRSGATTLMLRGIVPDAVVKTSCLLGPDTGLSSESSWAMVDRIPRGLPGLLANYGIEIPMGEGVPDSCSLPAYREGLCHTCTYKFEPYCTGRVMGAFGAFYQVKVFYGGKVRVDLRNDGDSGAVQATHFMSVEGEGLWNPHVGVYSGFVPAVSVGMGQVEQAEVHAGQYMLLLTMDERRQTADLAVVRFK